MDLAPLLTPAVSVALQRLATQVRHFYTTYKPNGRTSFVERFSVCLPEVDLLAWLSAQASFSEKLFWASRDTPYAVAAVGAAHRLFSDAAAPTAQPILEAHALLETHAAARYFGGIRFDNRDSPDEAWMPFGLYYFVLPRFELVEEAGQTTLTCNLVFPNDLNQGNQILAQLEGLSFPDLPLTGRFQAPSSRINAPQTREWRQKIVWLLEAFERGDLQKVVLARKASFGFKRDLDPVLLLKLLKDRKPDCFHFYFQPKHGLSFVAATPERLYQRREREILSEAVAGTRPRGATPEADAAIATELLGSEKDLREHAYVTRQIKEVLAPLCSDLVAEETPRLMTLTRRSHLYAQVRGTLKPRVHDADLIRALHPTPAVGGLPTRAAISTIAALEPFDRGWYAGPIGWIGKHAAEFAVGIRSGLIEGKTLSLFSGAGIVTGSTPDGEWDEIEQKICDFLEVFGL